MPVPTRNLLRRPRAAGFTLIEVVLTMAVLLVGALAVTSTSVVTESLARTDRERRTVAMAVKSTVEEVKAAAVQALDAEEGWARSLAADYAAGGIPGNEVDVPGMTPIEGENAVCAVQVVTDETLSDLDLGVNLGMPRDLDGDGVVANTDVRGSATLLPVIVRAQWRGAAGTRQLTRGLYILGF